MFLLILKIVLQVTVMVIALLICVLDYVWRDKRTKKFRKVRYLLFVLSGLALIGSIGLIIFDDRNNNQKEEDLKAQLKTVQEQNHSLRKAVDVLSDKSSNMLTEQRNSFVSVLDDQKKQGLITAENIKGATTLLNSGISESISKQQNLLKQQQTTLSNITGEGSYCYLQIGRMDENTVFLTLINSGEYPIHDVHIEVKDVENLKGMEGLRGKSLVDYIQKNVKSYDLGTLGKTLKTIDQIDLTGYERKNYRISVFSRYSIFHQNLQLAKVDGMWVSASQVYKAQLRIKNGKINDKLLKEEIDPRFPIEKKGDKIK